MSKETLIVKNFGPIKDVELELGKVNVFIGEQAGGKSTLAKLIAIFRDWDFLEEKLDYKTFFHQYKIGNYFSKETQISYKCEGYRISFLNSKISIDFSSQLKKKLDDRSILRDIIITDTENRPEYLTQFVIITNSIKPSVYFPAERVFISLLSSSIFSLLNNKIALPQFLIRFGSNYQVAKNSYENLSFPKFKISYENSNQNDLITFRNKKIKVENSSSGLQALLPLILVTEYNHSYGVNKFTDLSYIVEEPELNLYPKIQKTLIEFLVERCSKNGNNLILTTHSPYILTAISNLILAGNTLKQNPKLKKEIIKLVPEKYHLNFEDVQAYYVENGKVSSIMDKEYQTIDASPIDDVSDDLGETFDKLLDLKFQK
ncbi:MAG: AAA family ATPase [Saprospiraceae bacterium]